MEQLNLILMETEIFIAIILLHLFESNALLLTDLLGLQLKSSRIPLLERDKKSSPFNNNKFEKV